MTPTQEDPSQETYFYPRSRLYGTFALAGSGTLVMLGLVLLNPFVSWSAYLFLGLGIVFFLFLISELRKLFTSIRLDQAGIHCQGLSILAPNKSQFFPWQEVANLRLRYYASARQRKHGEGFLRLSVLGAGKKTIFSCDSELQGFQVLVRTLAEKLLDQGVEFDEITEENLAKLDDFFKTPF